jgi:hypothetical protein
MVHLCKLAVGVRDVAHLAALQERRLANPPLRHVTRNLPRRRDEIIDGGSIYWVIGGFLRVRQRVVDIAPARRDDGSPAAALTLDPTLVLVAARPTGPFQGWRYLDDEDVPADLAQTPCVGSSGELPESLAAELAELGLL